MSFMEAEIIVPIHGAITYISMESWAREGYGLQPVLFSLHPVSTIATLHGDWAIIRGVNSPHL